jgi:predicted DNA-binding transcriptional regulator
MGVLTKDQIIGACILLGSVVGVIVYGWLLFFVASQIVLQVTVFVALTLILGIMAWIGYTMMTTPSPPSIGNMQEGLKSTGNGSSTTTPLSEPGSDNICTPARSKETG